MLKKRVIGCIVVKDGIAVQSIGFRRYLPIGRPEIAASFLNRWGIDEISLLDISATARGQVDFAMIEKVAAESLVPITYGGGIRSAETMVKIIQSGADKVLLNAALREACAPGYQGPDLVREGAHQLGDQCLVASVDCVRSGGDYYIWDYRKRAATTVKLGAFCEDVLSQQPVGELFLNSVDQDGAQSGFDLKMASAISGKLKIPLILCGGAGHPEHFAEALKVPAVSAVAAGNYFQFTEHSPTHLKAFLNRAGLDLRLDSYFQYEDSPFTESGRIGRKPDARLKEMLFESHPPEVI